MSAAEVLEEDEDPSKLDGFSNPDEEERVQLSRYHHHIATRTRIAFDRAQDTLDELINVINDLVSPLVRANPNLKSMVAETIFKLHAAQSVILDARETMPAKSEVFRGS